MGSDRTAFVSDYADEKHFQKIERVSADQPSLFLTVC